MNKSKHLYSTFAVIIAILSGCAVGPDFKTPETDLPADWISPTAAATETSANWFAAFGDPLLDSLLETARTNNLSVKQAVQRVRASRAALSGARASFWPNAGISANASKAKSFDPDATTDRASIGFDASWELDIFGGIRRSVEASKAELSATEISLEDAMLTLDAELASEYVQLRLLQKQFEIAKASLSLQQDFLGIAKSKYDAGISSERDYLSAEAQLHSTSASIKETEASVATCIRAIEILLALNPGSLDTLLSKSAKIPNAPDVAFVAPSELLRRRPDIRKAERNYAAALARVGVATASYYPSVSIGAGASLSSSSFSDWGNAVKSLSFGPSVKWDILTFGRTKAKVEQAKAAAEEASLAYSETVLKAVHEVETTAIGLEKDAARAKMLAMSSEAQAKALAISRKMYEQDLGEYQEVISAQQSLLSAERSQFESEAGVTMGKIALYKALGGPYGNPSASHAK